MAYGNQFIKVTWMFSITDTDEVADTSLNFTTAPGWTGAVAALAELEAGEAYVGLVPNYVSLMSPVPWADFSTLVGVKVAAVGTDGHYLAAPLVYEDDTPTAGDQTSIVPQSTVVLTLRSGQALGKGNYGRMFLPHTDLGHVNFSPYGNPTTITNILAGAVDFLNDATATINDATTATLFPAIMSQAAGTPSKGITAVGVGRVVDTQRRRRNALSENYVYADLA